MILIHNNTFVNQIAIFFKTNLIMRKKYGKKKKKKFKKKKKTFIYIYNILFFSSFSTFILIFFLVNWFNIFNKLIYPNYLLFNIDNFTLVKRAANIILY